MLHRGDLAADRAKRCSLTMRAKNAGPYPTVWSNLRRSWRLHAGLCSKPVDAVRRIRRHQRSQLDGPVTVEVALAAPYQLLEHIHARQPVAPSGHPLIEHSSHPATQ